MWLCDYCCCESGFWAEDSAAGAGCVCLRCKAGYAWGTHLRARVDCAPRRMHAPPSPTNESTSQPPLHPLCRHAHPQDSKIQAAVIGISAAHNVAEDLEKRVLSRVGRRRVIVTFPAREEDVSAGARGGAGRPANRPAGAAV